MPTVTVRDQSGKEQGTLELRPEVFAVPIRTALLHQAVVRELAGRRAGTHDTKTRAEVSGGGRKPWRQKGTGRARQGTIRAPQWRGGGIVFGPHPRSYVQAMPRKARREALRIALADKLAAGQLLVVDRLALPTPKTRGLVALLAGLGIEGGPTLLVVAAVPDELARASRNIPWLSVAKGTHVSVYELLRHERVLFERAALEELQEALAS
ncbi:MAG: 50S ribosomal protein L4 [Candidatus Rokubacteria bacterium]|nr:50S ribosomal protein L4 [Candidatus Rokubacteria bacterium]MBI2879737.1 50S ribosomal protein L4 [Candidatus Rokubacteria bacterium]